MKHGHRAAYHIEGARIYLEPHIACMEDLLSNVLARVRSQIFIWLGDILSSFSVHRASWLGFSATKDRTGTSKGGKCDVS